jgi:lipoyl(octanoyl) transferase
MLSDADTAVAAPTALQVYLLGEVDFEASLRLQRRLHYEVCGDRSQAVLLLCEHAPLVTMGRHGSWAHILCGIDELRARQWPVRWVNRGGGCNLHQPGQLAAYSILPLDRLGLSVPAYLGRLQQVFVNVLDDFGVPAQASAAWPDVASGARVLAGLGVAVRNWVSYFGAWLNIQPALEPFRLVRWGGKSALPVTSLERERRRPLRPSLVRERLVEHFRDVFAFERVSLFSDHAGLDGAWTRCRETSCVG